ncbi:hypothetical protein MPSEU_000749900 [Mayamaea pseudoterrestris]|nr:hypothetical protein MPSEU_000749900 [Mayamaea pseudoterrestris]
MTSAIATPASTSRSPLQSSSLPEETITSIPSSTTEFDGSDGNIKHYHHNNYSLKPLKQALDPIVCQKASRYASRVHEEMSKRSTLLAEEAKILTVDRNDVMPYVGELLGKGGFNSVYELNLPKDVNAINATGSTGDANTSSALLQLVQTTSTQQLAIKFLSDSSMTVSEEFCNGAADLLMEAKYLCALSANHAHSHLIRIHAVCRAGAAGFSLADRAGYFIVIDRLVDTLDRRMDVWAELLKRNLGNVKRAKALYLQRLLICVDIASALKHLHQVKLLFRDLKPDNVGFDHNGQVKLFDFGLAKELDPKQKNGNNLYLMSGGTGSRRFMAPVRTLLLIADCVSSDWLVVMHTHPYALGLCCRRSHYRSRTHYRQTSTLLQYCSGKCSR